MLKPEGNLGFFISNLTKDKLSIICEARLVTTAETPINRRYRFKKDIPPLTSGSASDANSWGWKEFIKKDELDNKMKELVDQNGSLTICLELSGKK